MNSRYIWSTSVFVFLVAVTFAYQNCSKKEFAESSTSMISSITAVDQNGNTDGEVIIKSCKDDASKCPEFVTVRFYAFDEVNNKEKIGEVLGDKVLNDQGEVVYKFSFVVPKQYQCFKIKAYVVDPITQIEVEIKFEGGQQQTKALEEKCDDDDGPNDPPTGSGDPHVSIESVDKDGRLVQVNAKCAIGAPVVFSGDLIANIDKSENCTTGVIKHCELLTKYQNDNTIDGKQTLNGKNADDSAVVKWSNLPIKVITYESFIVDADQKNITITGYCNPTDTVKLSAYGGSTNASTVCTASGTYSVKAPILIPSLKDKGREVAGFGENSLAVGGNTPIITYDPDKNVEPVCALTATVANATMCTQQAGVVSGTCTKGLPVHVLVNGVAQNIGYCSSSGTFSVKNVLLSEVGISNTITIEQKNPYGKKCSSAKTLMNF